MFAPSKSLFCQSCVSSGSSAVGLMATSTSPQEGLCHSQVYCTQSACLCSNPLLTCTSTGDTQTQFWLSLCGVSGSWCVQGLFEPSEHLWRVQCLILNVISPLLPSCWGFSFALGCGISFFGWIRQFLVNGCPAVSCSFGVLVLQSNLGVLAGGDEHTSF